MAGRVNLTTYFGYPPYSLLCKPPKFNSAYENGLYYWSVQYSLLWNPDLWIPTLILDQGFYYKDYLNGSGGALGLFAARDASGALMSSPILLNGSGGKLADGADPEYIPFVEYETVDFNGLIP